MCHRWCTTSYPPCHQHSRRHPRVDRSSLTLRKVVIGSSALRICSWKKYARSPLHVSDGHCAGEGREDQSDPDLSNRPSLFRSLSIDSREELTGHSISSKVILPTEHVLDFFPFHHGVLVVCAVHDVLIRACPALKAIHPERILTGWIGTGDGEGIAAIRANCMDRSAMMYWPGESLTPTSQSHRDNARESAGIFGETILTGQGKNWERISILYEDIEVSIPSITTTVFVPLLVCKRIDFHMPIHAVASAG